MNGDYCSSSSKPQNIPLHYLKEITNNFSDVLGTGGFSVVYKGVQPNGVIVAVKKLLNSMPNSLEQLENEVHLLMRLEHPNIVRLIGYCYEIQKKHLPYEGEHVFAEEIELLLCLEYLPNGSLDRFLSDPDSRADWRTRYKIIEGICNGLQYLHEQPDGPIMHLDLKPANILLSEAFVPKIADFGLSRLLDRQETMYTMFSGGTLGYIPPEYLQGIITPMHDIYSLGVIIWEVVIGQRTHPDDTLSLEELIERELRKWRNMLQQAPGYTMLEIDQQIRRCIEIGQMCMNHSRSNRPKITKVIKMLQGLETTDCDVSNHVTSPSFQIRSGARELLYVYPNELSFSLEQDRQIRCLVKLINMTDEYVAFHFKATRETNSYCIEPASGFMQPLSTTHVVVTMEELGELVSSDLQFNDEFLVQSMVVREHRVNSGHIAEDTFNRMPSNAVHKVQLSIALVPPIQATGHELVPDLEATLEALQPEGSEDNSNAAMGSVMENITYYAKPVAAFLIYDVIFQWIKANRRFR